MPLRKRLHLHTNMYNVSFRVVLTDGGNYSHYPSDESLGVIRALPRVPTKGPLKPYRGTIHKTKAPPTAL
jgi:hypothetical protein